MKWLLDIFYNWRKDLKTFMKISFSEVYVFTDDI